MIVESGGYRFEWIDNWGQIPASPNDGYSGRTHGVVVTSVGEIVLFRQGNPAVVFLDPYSGRVIRAWGDYSGAHGLTIAREDGSEWLWLTDTNSGTVVKTSLCGEEALRVNRPDHPAYRAGKYSPTWVAVDDDAAHGSGDFWIADGYGSSLVHRYDRKGAYAGTLDGSAGAGKFSCPHAIWVDPRHAELYVADRSNRRIQVFNRQGAFQHSFGEEFLTKPCSFARYEGRLLIPELCARLTLVDEQTWEVSYIGANESVCGMPGYPNERALLVTGKFHAPHAAAVDAHGNIYVVEWIVGGRLTKLSRVE